MAKQETVNYSPISGSTNVLRNKQDGNLPTSSEHRYIHAASSDNTRRTYQSAIRHFEAWGGLLPATATDVIRYLLAHAESLSPRTLSLRLTAIKQWHQLQKFPDPTDATEVSKTLKGIERIHGQPKKKAKVFSLEHLEDMISYLVNENDLKATRDQALLLLGFFGALRRSELTALTLENIIWEPEGIVILLPRSKTDQTGEGIAKALPYGEGQLCPVKALKHWLHKSGIKEGTIFRGVTRWSKLQQKGLNPSSINLVLKSVACKTGLDFVSELSSHSLRRSLATNAHRSGASFDSIKRQGGWSHDGTVWNYIEEAQRFEDNAAAVLLARAKELAGKEEQNK